MNKKVDNNYLRKELYTLLKEEDFIFDFIQESLLDSLWYWDLENPENEWMNTRFWIVLGYDPDEMPHKSSAWQNIINRDDLKVALDNFNKHLEDSSRPYDQNVRYTHKNGSIVWIRFRGLAIRNKHGKPIRMLGAHQDITAIKESEIKLKEAQQIAQMGNWELDLIKNELVWSEEVYRIFDSEPQEFKASYEAFLDFVHPEDRENVDKAYTNSLQTKTPYEIEHRLITKNGKVKYVKEKCRTGFDEFGNPLKSFGIVIDITEQKQNEEELKKAKERAEENRKQLDRIANNLVDGMIYQTMPIGEDGRQLNYISDGVTKLYGCTPQEAKEDPMLIYSRIHPDDIAGLAQKEEEVLEEKKTFKHEFRVINPDGSIRWSYCVSYPRFTDGVLCWDGIEIDITKQKQNEEELEKAKEEVEENQKKLLLAIERTEQGTWEWNLETGEVNFNDSWIRILGYEPDGWKFDMDWWNESLEEGVGDKVIEAYTAYLEGRSEQYEIEYRIKNRHDKWIWVKARGAAIKHKPDGTPLVMFGVLENITKQKNAGQELKNAKERAEENEYFLRKSQSAGNIGSFKANFVSDYWKSSKTLDNIYGIDDSYEHKSSKWLDFVHPDEREMLGEYLEGIIKNKANFDREYRIIRINDGQTRWVHGFGITTFDSSGKLFEMIGTVQDITERKIVELQLKEAKERAEESEQTFRRLFEDSSDAILLIDNLGVFVECNQAALDLLKMTRKQFLFISPVEISPTYQPNGRKSEEVAQEMINLANNSGLHRFDWTHINSEGGEFIVEVSLMPIVIKGQTMLHTTWRDITERKKIEQDLIDAKEKAEESDRLKSAFLANMSHEIRTPMNGILGFADLLKEPGLSGKKQKQYVNIIEKSGIRMLETINNIINISKIESGQVQLSISDIDIDKEIEYLYEFFLPEAEKKGVVLSVVKERGNHKVVLESDKDKLNSILTNLIKNALKFTYSGRIEYGYSLKQKELEFYVKDTGIGIPADRQNAIFDRFVQADIEDKDVYEGSGLGLAISNAYVEMLGGKMWVESEEGVGSSFCFTLPNHLNGGGEVVKENIADVVTQQSGQQKIKILIADDDEFVLTYLEAVLEDWADKMLVAKTGLEAIEIARSNLDIDLILMDIKIPGVNGLEATRQIREFNDEVFILAQTAFAHSGYKEKCLEAGCDNYIAKPIDKEQLLEMISKHFQNRTTC